MGVRQGPPSFNEPYTVKALELIRDFPGRSYSPTSIPGKEVLEIWRKSYPARTPDPRLVKASMAFGRILLWLYEEGYVHRETDGREGFTRPSYVYTILPKGEQYLESLCPTQPCTKHTNTPTSTSTKRTILLSTESTSTE